MNRSWRRGQQATTTVEGAPPKLKSASHSTSGVREDTMKLSSNLPIGIGRLVVGPGGRGIVFDSGAIPPRGSSWRVQWESGHISDVPGSQLQRPVSGRVEDLAYASSPRNAPSASPMRDRGRYDCLSVPSRSASQGNGRDRSATGGRQSPVRSRAGDAGDTRLFEAELAGPPQRRNRGAYNTAHRMETVDVLRRHSRRVDQEAANHSREAAFRNRCGSHAAFADRSQTIIFFDWDDTLFPTSHFVHELQLDWQVPMAEQKLHPKMKRDIVKKLERSERQAGEILGKAHCLGHVVVLTLAAKGWVEQACRMFYPKVGEMMRNLEIKIVNANATYKTKTKQDQTDEEWYGLMKGRAIMKEIESFYSQYEGQSWKNVISVGDSVFERYGLLAASTAYMKQQRLSNLDQRPFLPSELEAWQKVRRDDRVVKLRVKCCKLVDVPDIDELVVELDMVLNFVVCVAVAVSKWLGFMVALDEGFDLNLEALVDVQSVGVVEACLRGLRPVKDMPRIPLK